jgi:hypothetical protein
MPNVIDLSTSNVHKLRIFSMFAAALGLIVGLVGIAVAAPAPVPSEGASPEFLTPVGPIRFAITVLSFNYFEDYNCQTPLGSMNISGFDLNANKCFDLPGNSLVFTYQEHTGTLSYYNPNEVNSKHRRDRRTDC